MLGALRSLHQNAHSSLPGTDGNQGKSILNSLESIGSRSLVYCCFCFPTFDFFFFLMTKGLPSKLKSHTCLHFTIPFSPPSHCTYQPSPSYLYFKGMGGGQRNTTKATSLAGGLRGGGGGTNLILPHLLKSITTFEIKFPSVQRITCAMLGCYFGLGLSSSQ